MTNPRSVRPSRPGSRTKRALSSAVALIALAGTFAASGVSTPTSEPTPAAVSSGSGPVTFAMEVKPGQPVPLKLVTENSMSDFAGQGAYGQGIDVALVDTGVAPVQGLDAPGKVVYGPDLSNEGAVDGLVNLDTYGHGTHLAGIINGEDAGVSGVAPKSRVVSVKVAGASGETDITQVIAAIDWVVEHRNDDGLNIRVLNLSLGMPGVKTNQGDPLSAAVERAWDAGIVVVAATGNRGNEFGGIDSPAVSPYVIAVGAHEMYESSGSQDRMASWSSGGNTYRQPDVVAPGRSIMSFRVPGSTLDQKYPTAVVEEKYFLGSGSSQSTAVVSGYVAALLSASPDLTNDQVKFLFEQVAVDFKETPDYIDGDGKISPKDVARNVESAAKAPVQNYPKALSSKGSDAVLAPSGATWSGGTWNGATWSGGTWNGATWSGATWSGATWSGGVWSGATWSGATWSGATWSAGSWS